MAKVLVISSMVARGHVGLSAAVPILQRAGVETLAFPTVLLSNHPGHARFAGTRIAVTDLRAMLDAIEANGWLAEVDAVLTGYFPTEDHVAFAASAISRIRKVRPTVLACCDPVLGDVPDGLYVSAEVASAVRGHLLPLCQVATPNAFELEWLSGIPVATAHQAVAASRRLPAEIVLTTSVPAGAAELANVVTSVDGAWQSLSARRPHVPHGTGDAMAAVFLAARLRGESVHSALAAAAGCLDALVSVSEGRDELQLIATAEQWSKAAPAGVIPVS